MLLAFLLAQAAAAIPPAPPPDPGKQLHDSIVTAIRNCPQSKGDEIAVCSKDRGYAQRYRLEKLQKPIPVETGGGVQLQLASPDTARTGTGSCSAGGAGGSTGCSAKQYDDWARWKNQQKADNRNPPW